MNDPQARQLGWQDFAILSLLAASFMIFQIGLLRELRFQLSTIFTLTPFLFSSVVVFIGLGSIAAARVRIGSRRFLRWGVPALPLMLLPVLAATIALAQATMDHTGSGFSYGATQASTAPYTSSVAYAFVVVALLGYGIVFFVQGLIFAAYFAEARHAGLLSRMYAIDLLASGLAALAGGALSFVMTPIEMALISTGLLLLALWLSFRSLRIPLRLVVMETLLVAGMIGAEVGAGPIAALEAPDWLPGRLVDSRWSPYRRIDVSENPPLVNVFADGIRWHHYNRGELDHVQRARSHGPRLVFEQRPDMRDVLVVGGGTGADVRNLRDMVPHELDITTVELDSGFVQTARQLPWLWDAYSTAEIIVQEGRYFLETTERTFDLVLYAFVDPQAAISSVGLPDANFLYTASGLRAAYDRVRDDGYLVISRVFFADQHEEFFTRLCATLDATGIPRSEVTIGTGTGTIGFAYYGNLGSACVAIHKGGTPPSFGEYTVAWIDGGQPTTDRYPFSIMIEQWFSSLAAFVQDSLAAMLVLGLAAAALLLRISTSPAHASFFFLGLASFLVECLVLYSSFLLIGNPSLSAAAGIGFFLFWNGIGSYVSDRLQRHRAFFVLVPLVVLGYALTAPMLNAATLAVPVWGRLTLFAIHLALPGIIVGAMFPIGMRRHRDKRVSSLFFIDLVGCAVAPVLFWLALSVSGIGLITLGTTVGYGALAIAFRPRG